MCVFNNSAVRSEDYDIIRCIHRIPPTVINVTKGGSNRSPNATFKTEVTRSKHFLLRSRPPTFKTVKGLIFQFAQNNTQNELSRK